MRAIETKVIAGAAGGGGGAAVASFTLWLLGVVFWSAPAAADHAGDAVAAVPSPVAVLVGVVLTAAGGFLSGYAAPHTNRTATEAEPTPAGRHASDAAPVVTLSTTDDLNTPELLGTDPPQPTPVQPDPFMEGG